MPSGDSWRYNTYLEIASDRDLTTLIQIDRLTDGRTDIGIRSVAIAAEQAKNGLQLQPFKDGIH